MPADKEKSKEQLITELIALRATLAATEERLVYTRRFVENSPVSLILMKDGKCVDCNMAALPLFGLHSKDEIIGTTPIDFAPEFQPDGRLSIEAATNYNQKALEDGSVNFEWESVRRDGRHIMTYVRLVSLNLGGEEFLECVTVDITERKQADAALKHSKSHMEAVARIATLATSSVNLKEVLDRILAGTLEETGASVGMIFLRDAATGCLEWGASSGLSDAFVNEFSSRRIQPGEGLSGRIALAGEPIYIAENSSNDPRIARSVIREEGLNTFIGVPVRAGEEIVGVMNILTRTPAVLSQSETSLINAIGTQVGFAIRNARLFKEREEAKEALLTAKRFTEIALDSQLDTFFVFEPATGKAIRWNEAFRTLSGYSDEEISSQKAPDSYYSQDDLKKAAATTQNILKEGMATIELSLIAKDGRTIPTEYTATAIKNAEGNPEYIIAVGRNISERKRTEAEKKELEAQLRQSQKLETIGTMVGGIAHDFNNMMQPIKSCVEMMNLQLPADSPFFEYVNLISRSVDRGRDLVKQLLNFSRKREHEMVPLHMQQVVNETLHLLRAAVPATVEIHKEINTECGPVMADPINIQQIVMNLCANACDAMAGHGKLSIQLTEATITAAEVRHLMLSRPGNYLRLSISDTGHGMDEVTKKKIFDPFFTTKEVGKGTGLGLSVVHSIVVNHGGAITVKSEPGKGTEFHVYLPRCEEMPYLPAEQDKEPAQGGQGEVLFVDDEEDIVFIGGEMLESLGYNVVACSSHKDALREIEREPDKYGLVISDYSMPGMNGIQFAGKIREIRPDIPILFITGNEQAIPSDKLSELKVQSILPKPFDMKTLGVMVRKVLAQG
ncbi:MAG: PAS domain S-box protein [Nitrospirota bacterium]|nr:PAS domain S-box protein [Nitrospirota bacterium]